MKRYSHTLTKLLVLFLLVHQTASAQMGTIVPTTHSLTASSPGFLHYQPVGYDPNNTSVKYPLMIYFVGLGSHGDGTNSATGLEKLYTGSPAPHDQYRAGTWQDAYTVPSGTYQFVIVTPQFATQEFTPGPGGIDSIITNAINFHPGKIDTTRIYLVGHSQGAGIPWEYVGHSSRYATRIAAILPVSAVVLPTLEKAWRIRFNNVGVWAFHNTQDNLVPYKISRDFVDYVNEPPAPTQPAKLTSLGTTGHDVGGAFYRGPIPNEPYNVFQWLLLHQRMHTTVFAGEDIFIHLPTTSAQLTGTDRRPSGTITSTVWSKVSGPSQFTIANPNNLSTTVSNLEEGIYVFRLTVTAGSETYFDDVTVQVRPPMTRIEAETFIVASSSPGITTEPSPSEGGTVVRLWSSQRFLDYSITAPVAGMYWFRFRAGAFVGDQKFVIERPDGTFLDSVRVYPTNHDVYQNLFALVPLQAGTQTIRLRNTAQPTPVAPGNEWMDTFFNWFEFFNSRFTMSPLPVRFAQTNVRCNNGAAELTWRTALENNSKEFRIERSTTGTDWNVVGTLAAAGQSTTERSYSFRDATTSNNAQYRIIAIDLDGRQTISPVLRSTCGGSKSTLTVFPNPVREDGFIRLGLERGATVRFTLFNQAGALVKDFSQVMPAGTTQLPIDLNGLPAGSYTLRAAWNDETQTVKWIKGK